MILTGIEMLIGLADIATFLGGGHMTITKGLPLAFIGKRDFFK
jgi:hypothetical protein